MCYCYGHIAMTCYILQTSRNCAEGHQSAASLTARDPRTYFYSNCKGKHEHGTGSAQYIKQRQNKLQQPKPHDQHSTRPTATPYQLLSTHESVHVLSSTLPHSQLTQANSPLNLEQHVNGHNILLFQLLENQLTMAQ